MRFIPRWGNVAAVLSSTRLKLSNTSAHTCYHFILSSKQWKFGMWANALIGCTHWLSKFSCYSHFAQCICSSWTWIHMVGVSQVHVLNGWDKSTWQRLCLRSFCYSSFRWLVRSPIHSFHTTQCRQETFDFMLYRFIFTHSTTVSLCVLNFSLNILFLSEPVSNEWFSLRVDEWKGTTRIKLAVFFVYM